MELYRLSVFLRVMERRSVSRAAEELNLTQPAVTLHIRKLEEEIGIRLFERQGRHIAPTEAAHVLYRYALAVFDTLEQARKHLQDFREGKRGRVQVGAGTTSLYYLPGLLRAYKARYPHVEIMLRSDLTDRIREAVASGALDLGFIWGPVSDTRLNSMTLGYDTFVVIAPPDHPLARQTLVAPEALSGEPLILTDEGTATRNFTESRLRAIGVVPKVVIPINITEAIKRAVESGLGLAIIPRKAAELELRDGTLSVLNIADTDFRRPVVITWRRTAALSAPAQALLNMAQHVPLTADPQSPGRDGSGCHQLA